MSAPIPHPTLDPEPAPAPRSRPPSPLAAVALPAAAGPTNHALGEGSRRRDRLVQWVLVLAAAGCALALGAASALSPLLGVAGLLVLVAMAGFVRSGSFAVAAFVTTTFFESFSMYTGDALSPIKLAGGALVAAAMLTLLQRRRGDAAPSWYRHPIVVGAMVSFVLVGLASAAWAQDLAQVKSLSIRLATDALVFLAVATFVRRPAQLHVVAWATLVAAVGSTLFGALIGTALFDRFIGGFTDPNEYAAAAVPAMALGFGALQASRGTLLRVTGWAAIAFCFWGIVASESRGGLLALVVALVVIVASSRGRERMRMVGMSFLAVAGAMFVMLLTPQGQTVMARIDSGDSSGRADLWHVAVNMVQQHPLTGVGLGNYPVLSKQYLDPGTQHAELFVAAPRVVHNTPLEIAAELGLLGLVPFLVFIVGAVLVQLRAVRRTRRLPAHARRQLAPLGRGLLAATLSALASGAFLSGQYQELLWVLLALGIAYAGMVRRAGEQHLPG